LQNNCKTIAKQLKIIAIRTSKTQEPKTKTILRKKNIRTRKKWFVAYANRMGLTIDVCQPRRRIVRAIAKQTKKVKTDRGYFGKWTPVITEIPDDAQKSGISHTWVQNVWYVNNSRMVFGFVQRIPAFFSPAGDPYFETEGFNGSNLWLNVGLCEGRAATSNTSLTVRWGEQDAKLAKLADRAGGYTSTVHVHDNGEYATADTLGLYEWRQISTSDVAAFCMLPTALCEMIAGYACDVTFPIHGFHTGIHSDSVLYERPRGAKDSDETWSVSVWWVAHGVAIYGAVPWTAEFTFKDQTYFFNTHIVMENIELLAPGEWQGEVDKNCWSIEWTRLDGDCQSDQGCQSGQGCQSCHLDNSRPITMSSVRTSLRFRKKENEPLYSSFNSRRICAPIGLNAFVANRSPDRIRFS
jgi:hypothetical protein